MDEPRGPLVGRSAELKQLRAAVSRVADGPPVLIEISGAAGIGKTALLDRLADDATVGGLTVLRGAGHRREQDQAFGVLMSLFDGVLSSSECVSALDRHDVSDLASVLPSLRSHCDSPAESGPINPLLVCRALRRALAVFAGPSRGLALLIDDMHWVDEATASVIGYLCRHGTGTPLLVGVAMRPTAWDSSLIATGGSRSNRAELIALGPIADDEAAALLRGIAAKTRAAVLDAAAGNPFFLTQLAAHARSRHPAHAAAHAPADAAADAAADASGRSGQLTYPAAVTGAILEELAALPLATQRLARCGAVLGDPFQVVQAGRLADLSGREPFAAIDELVGCALVVSADDRGSYRFRHPIITTVLYETAPSGWRLDTHSRAARVLAQAGADPIQVASHLERCASIGDEAAIDSIAATAMQSRALAPSAAARLLGSALGLIPAGTPLSDRRAWLIGTRADCLIRSGQSELAREELLEAIALVPPEDITTRAALTAACVRVERWLGMHQAAFEHLMAMLDQLPEQPSIARVALESFVMLEAVERIEVKQMRLLGGRAAATATALGDVGISFVVTAGRAFCEARIGDPSLAIALVDDAVAQADHLSASQVQLVLDGIVLLSSTQHWLGDSEGALRHARRGIELAQTSGNVMAEMWLRLAAESALTGLGQLGSAAEMIDDAEQLARTLHHDSAVCAVLGRRSNVAVLMGDSTVAETLVQDCEVYLELAVDPYLRGAAALALAPVLLQTGQPGRCAELILTHSGGSELPHIAKPLRAMFFALLAQGELARGDLDAACTWADRACEADIAQVPITRYWGQSARSAVLVAAGEPSAAVDAAAVAVRAADEAGSPIDLARARMIAGQALAAAGFRDEATDSFRRALQGFEAHSARGLAAAASGALRSLGVRTVGRRIPRNRAGSRDLSVREHEVADLVADGLTNRQIAQRLFLSIRTVESHLSRILRKLGVTARAEVAAAARRQRIVAQSVSAKEQAKEQAKKQRENQ